MNGMMRLIWTYLYRCRENNSTTMTRLEGILKHFFPSSRLLVFPNDEHLEPLIYIVHFIVSRLFDFGRDLTLNLMQEQAIRSAQPSNVTQLLAPERTTIALEAILRSLYLVEKDEPIPSWPSNIDFNVLPDKDDYPTIATFCPQSFMSKPGMQDFFDRCGSTVAYIAVACAKSVGRMSILDEQWSVARPVGAYEDTANFIIRQHPEGSVAYPVTLAGQVNTLQMCFSSWPRCLHPTLPLEDAVDMLIRAILHVEPTIGEAATGALQRIIEEPSNLSCVLSRFFLYLFSPKLFTAEVSNSRLPFQSLRVLNVWLSVVRGWVDWLKKGVEGEEARINAQFLSIEAAAFFLLSLKSRSGRSVGVKLVHVLEDVFNHFKGLPSSPLDETSNGAFQLLHVFLDKEKRRPYLDGFDDLVDTKQQSRLAQWKQSTFDHVLLRIAESDDERDRNLWWMIYPSVVRTRISHRSKIIASCREMWIAATARYHSAVVSLSGISNRVPTAPPGRIPPPLSRERDKIIADNLPMIEQWHLWVKLICSTASPPESKAMSHSRAPSDLSPDRDLIASNTRGLFRYLIPFLDASHNIFCEIAELCISSFPGDTYRDLLEDLGAFSARYFYVDHSRVKMSPTSMSKRNRRQDRLYLAVAHIYQLTAHYLKDQRGVGRQDSLTNVLKFVRHTQTFLSNPDVREDWQQQRLRRYFCGIVEQLFDGLSSLQSSDRFIPARMHLSLYRLCEEWCQCGSQSDEVKMRLIKMQTAATVGCPDAQYKATAIEKFQTETRLLSHAASGAMASLCVCRKAFVWRVKLF